MDGDLVLTDSSVICEYLEDLKPKPALYPKDVRDRARRAGSRSRRHPHGVTSSSGATSTDRDPTVGVGEKGDKALVEKTLNEDIPAALDYLEAQARRRAFASARCRSPTSRRPVSCAPLPSCASRSMPRVGRGRRVDGSDTRDAGVQEGSR